MKYLIITIIFLFSCKEQIKKSPLPDLEQLIENDYRRCDSKTADIFSSEEDMFNQFNKPEIYKDSFELNLYYGLYNFQNKNFAKALIRYKESLRIDSINPISYFNIALTYCELNNLDEALIYINKALNLCKNKWAYLNSKCYILGELDRCEEAIKVGLISFKLKNDYKKIYGNLLNCFYKMNEQDSINKYISIATKELNLDENTKKIFEIKYQTKNN